MEKSRFQLEIYRHAEERPKLEDRSWRSPGCKYFLSMGPCRGFEKVSGRKGMRFGKGVRISKTGPRGREVENG